MLTLEKLEEAPRYELSPSKVELKDLPQTEKSEEEVIE